MINIASDSTGLLVKPDVAAKQIAAETPSGLTSESPSSSAGSDKSQSSPSAGGGQPPASHVKLKHFRATVQLDPSRIGRDAGRIAEEVVQHLALLPDANVEIVLEIQAELPEGAPDKVVRTVTENRRTLKFKSQGFEQA